MPRKHFYEPDPDHPSWFRNRHEPLSAYEAFKIYRGTFDYSDEDPLPPVIKGKSKGVEYLPQTDLDWDPKKPCRSLLRVASLAHSTYYTIAHFSTIWKWKDRAFEYDTYVEQRVRDQIDAAAKLKIARFLEIRDVEAERIVAHAEALREQFARMAARTKLDCADDTVVEHYDDGRPKTIHRTYKPVGWTVKDLALLAEASTELMTQALQLVFGDAAKPAPPAETPLPPELASLVLRASASGTIEAGGNGDGDGKHDP